MPPLDATSGANATSPSTGAGAAPDTNRQGFDTALAGAGQGQNTGKNQGQGGGGTGAGGAGNGAGNGAQPGSASTGGNAGAAGQPPPTQGSSAEVQSDAGENYARTGSASGVRDGALDAGIGTIRNGFDPGAAVERLNSDGDAARFDTYAEGKVLVPVPTPRGIVQVGGKGQYGYDIGVTRSGDANPSYEVTFEKNLLAGAQAETGKGMLPDGLRAGGELNAATSDRVTMTFDNPQDAARAVRLLQHTAAAETARDAARLTDPSLSNPAGNPLNGSGSADDVTADDYAPGGDLNPATQLREFADRVAPSAQETAWLQDHVTSYSQVLSAQERGRFEAKLGQFGIEGRLDANQRVYRTVDLPRDGEPGRLSYAVEGGLNLTSKEKVDLTDGLFVGQVFTGRDEFGIVANNIRDVAQADARLTLSWNLPDSAFAGGGQPFPDAGILNSSRLLQPDEMSLRVTGQTMVQSPLDVSRTDLLRGEVEMTLANPDQHAAALFNGAMAGDLRGVMAGLPADATARSTLELVQRDGSQTQTDFGVKLEGLGEGKISFVNNYGNDDVVRRSTREWTGAPPEAGEPPPPQQPQPQSPAAGTPEQLVVVPHEGLNLRAEPSADATRAGVLYHGTFVQPTGEVATDAAGREWVQVNGPDVNDRPVTGWVAREFTAAHSEGAMDATGRVNPDLAAAGHRGVPVQPGDTIWSIAQANGADTRETVALNSGHLIDPNMIFAGDTVYLPGANPPPAPPAVEPPAPAAPATPPADGGSSGGATSGNAPSTGNGATASGGGPGPAPGGVAPSTDAAAPPAGNLAGRPDVAQIRQDYRVESDPGGADQSFQAQILGVGVGPTINGITATERDMLARLGLLELNELNGVVNRAQDESRERYPLGDVPTPAHVDPAARGEWEINDGHRDAFRHTYWNALMARHQGPEWAEQYATAHEGLPEDRVNQVRETMDLYNNEVGRRIAAENPNASDDELADLVTQAARDGELLVVDANGNLAWSDQVAFGQHGLASPGGNLPGGQPVPAGDASAR